MIYFTCFIHGNIQYAEFSEKEVPAIVEQSYLPALEYFASRPDLRGIFEYSGVTLEAFAKRWPRAIDLLRLMAERGQIEIMGSTYANPILPLLPTTHAWRQLTAFCDIYNNLFGDLTSPQGIYLQEFAYDPSLAPLLRRAGYRYTILTPELILAGMRRSLNIVLKPLGPKQPEIRQSFRHELLHPLWATGAGESRLAVLPLQRDLIDFFFAYSNGEVAFDDIASLLASLDAAYCQSFPGLLTFGPSDAEFVGYYNHMGRRAIQVEALGDLLDRIRQLPFIRLGLPAEYLDNYQPGREVYIPAGSSEPSLDIWTRDPDNQRLNLLCAEAAQKIQLAEFLAGKGRSEGDERLKAAWQAIMLAENSDGRGWIPCPERRLFCYDQALLAIRLAEDVIFSNR